MTDASCAKFFAILGLPLLAALAACGPRPTPITLPVGPPVPESLIQDYVREGDEFYQAMHLCAWRKAETAYRAAYLLAPRPEIRDKLALATLLRMTREVDEDIPCPTLEEDVRFICANPPDERAQALCDLARGYAAGPVAAAEQGKRVNPAVLQLDTSPLDAYFFALHARTFGLEAKNAPLLKQLGEKFRASPLFMYWILTLGSATARFPDFAEAWEFSAEMSFQRSQLKPARAGFSKSIELIPDYTRAIVGLGNIYFFKLEDYDSALIEYSKALRWDPQCTAALFGKGAALHHLDRYEESNAALDQMLASDISRKGRVTRDSVQYYRGQANYYKSYNYQLMKDPALARELIDVAKQHLPSSEEINYLSGLLYFNANRLNDAKADFERAVKAGKNCYAYHYLGLIEFKIAGPSAASHFLTSTACLERSLRTFRDNIQSLDALDIDPAEKQAVRLRMERRLLSYRGSAGELIQRMIALIRGSEIDDKWKRIYIDTLSDLLAKVQAIRAGAAAP